ncbi:phage holin family protein [Gryllotalpicola ginsengisoli]|uniref:phage holin family protein n=1 Tax=Gryllotalpicola ginsengisoli TaxID=444608 RepID=UPI0006863A7B|nr:phage holin family protein [Gryllotalpicola ginsengisoli]
MTTNTGTGGDTSRIAVHDESLGELIAGATRDLSTLVSQEIELAKAEAKQSVTSAATAGGMFAVAVYGALMGVFFLSVALWWALGTLVGNGWSGLIVAVIWLLIAAVGALVGRQRLSRIGLQQTAEAAREIPETLKPTEEPR